MMMFTASTRTARMAARAVALLLILLGTAGSVRAADVVELVGGTRFENVQVVRRDAEVIQVRVPEGMLWIDVSCVEKINGVPVRPLRPPTPPAPPLIPSRATDPSQPMPGLGSARAVPPTFSGLPATGEIRTPARASPKSPVEYVHDWRMEKWMGLVVAVCAAWMLLLVGGHLVAQSYYGEDQIRIQRWNAANLLLPGSGFLVYLVAQARVWRARREMASEQSTAVDPNAPVTVPPGAVGSRLPTQRIPFSSSRSRGGNRIEFEFLNPDGEPIEVRHDETMTTGLEFARDVLGEAIGLRASDVHLEPHEKGYRVRYRVDGLLQERVRYDKAEGQRVLLALKALAQIDMAAKQAALDGRFRIQAGTRDIDVRAATTTSIFGEKMVLRILDRKRGVLSLADLGMSEAARAEFDRLIHSRSGMILATGPTGCGKTTTLYSALSTLDQNQLNIMTIEDPVEYQLEGATQISVNPRAGVTYESGLRSILRQDPDVVLVGEMRDAEAATIAIRAALAGHLVLSSVHTNDAPTTIVRLEEMGIEPHRISAALLMVIAQRLVRVLCRECRELHEPKPEALTAVGLTSADAKVVYRAVGCPSCDGTGYQGRTAIFELLVMDDDLRQAVAEGVTPQALAQMARRKGFKSYREDGAAKIVAGITSVEEVQLAG
jgi:general secretion pathway protein E